MTREDFAKKCRKSIIGTQEQVPLLDGSYVTGVNFDNAATTPPFYAVLSEIGAFAPWCSSVHRGTGYKSMVSSDIFDEGREKLKAFVGADKKEDVLIYTKNTTEAINLLANAFYQMYPDAVILSTQMEHLANDLPWRDKFRTDHVRVDKAGRLDLNDLEYRLGKYQGKVRLVAVTGASNVTGYVNPIHAIAAIAHRAGAEIFVDGAQLVPHKAVDMKGHACIEHIDYLAFSAHKMYAPFGVGALIGPERSFRSGTPFLKGGGAVRLVADTFVDWDDPPYREEAGTPNVIGTAAFLKAVSCLRRLDMSRIHACEQEILAYIVDGLEKIAGISLYGNCGELEEKVSIISFALPDIPHRLIAQILSYEFGIAVRSGLFCAHPYVQRLMGMTAEQIGYYRQHPEVAFPGLVRVSLGLYQQYEEADRLLYGIRVIAENKELFRKKYEKLFGASAEPPHPLFHPLKRQLL